MLTITEVQTRILEALHRYKFLTNSQMAQLDIGNLQFIRTSTKKLSSLPSTKKPFVGVIKFPITARSGRIENAFYLTEYGAEVLADILSIDYEELDFQKVTSVYHRDYWHRKYTIDFHIWLTQALENSEKVEIGVFDRYFDKTGANRKKGQKHGTLRAKTRVDFPGEDLYIIPDVNFTIESKTDSEKRALFCFEMTNGRNTKRILNQIYKHTFAMQHGAMAEKYGVPRSDYICLFLFSELGLMEAVRERFYEVPDGRAFHHAFYFAHIDEAKHEVLRCWQKVKMLGEERWNFVSGKNT